MRSKHESSCYSAPVEYLEYGFEIWQHYLLTIRRGRSSVNEEEADVRSKHESSCYSAHERNSKKQSSCQSTQESFDDALT